MYAAGSGHQPNAGLGQAEPRRVGGHDDVARQRHLEAPAEGIAVDGSQDRLPAAGAVGEAAESALGHAHHVPAVLGGEPQVVAGRERLVASTGEDADPDVGIVLEIVPDLVELEVGRGVERVHPLGTVDGDDGDASLLLIGRELVGH